MEEHFERTPNLAMMAVAALGFWGGSEASAVPWLGILVGLVGVADVLWGMRNPLVTVTPRALIVRPAMLRRPRELPLAQIAAWAANPRLLRIEMLDGSRHDLMLTFVSKARRQTLRERISELLPDRSAAATKAGLRRYERRMWLFAGAMALAMLAIAFSWVFRAQG